MSQLPTAYQHFIYISRYSRWLEKENRRETWDETVERYFNFFENHLKVNQKYDLDPTLRQELKDAILNLEIMPSMRCLMTAGPALDRSNIAGYNCAYIAINRVRAFDEVLMTLMCGTGVGFSVERQYVEKLPTISESFSATDTTIIVEDSKTGWAKAYKELVSLLIGGQIPKWDLSKVRAAGARLKTFGGRASGPRPLEDLFKFTIDTFKRASGRKLTSLECHDLVCKIAEVVVVGGVRRSALISLSNLTDERMRDAKSGAWWEANPQRALANNSVAYKEKPEIGVFMDEWVSLYKSKSGERGIFNREAAKKTVMKLGDRRDPNHEWGVNPCCLDGDTLVQTNLGQVPLSQIVADTEGYTVLSMNHDTNKLEYTEILTGDITRPDAEIIKIEIVSANNSITTLRLTSDHQVWTENRGYVEAGSLTEEDVVVIYENYTKTISGKVKSIKKLKDKVDTYDIQTPNQNFFANGVLVHNCEILLRDREFCNLSEVIVRPNDTQDDLSRKIRLATILGTWQASLTNFPYLSAEWKKNCEEEALLGVSLTGIMDNPMMFMKDHAMLGVVLEEMKQVAIDTNKEWAKKIHINPSAAITTTKPSGTVSQLCNTASGIHARHSEYYVRTVRADRKDPLCQMMIDMGFPNEPCVMKPDTTMIFSFPQSAVGSVTRKDMTAIEHLQLWITYQRHWTEHKPSVTISVAEHEWLEVGAFVYKHFDEISGISFLPISNHSYRQAPYQDCTKEEYEALLAKMPQNVDWDLLVKYEKEDNTKSSQSFACSANSCEMVDLT